ncbi:hypothetical protein BKA70DRAFT_1139349 [Coprinopsis sp. MPI-PUGE-AT-0042]|nr:hypothetical protein BKA70DRAFT_1139349 [Coprinopsis sp. MPI-PUGE-AT-0042]
MVSDPPPDLLVERAVSKLKQASYSAEALKRALDDLDANELAKVNNGEVIVNLECSKVPFARLLELVLSYGQWSSTLKSCLLRTFPAHNREVFVKSVHRYVVERLSVCLLFLPIPFDREQARAITGGRAKVELSIQVLETINSMTFDNTKKALNMAVTLDPKVLARLGLSVPHTTQDAENITNALLSGLLVSLERYFVILEYKYVYTAIQESSVIQLAVDVPNNLDTAQDQAQENGEDAAKEVPAPSAFPMVQPMKAALYFDSAEGFGEWRILLSTRADGNLRDWRRRDAEFFKIIIKKIKELSCGHFSADNQKRLNKPDVDFPIFEAKMTRDTRLVYQIDCVPEYDSNFESQVIKVFGIYTHAQIDKRFWDSMGYQLCKKGKEYRDRCKFRSKPFNAGDYVVEPASFPPVEVETKDDIIVPELPEKDLGEIHSLLVLEKFVMMSQALLNSILADLDVAHVFNVTPHEKEIIEHPFSCYVLGRSGTGKTTTMLFKMLGIERAYAIQSGQFEDACKPRQIFVTQSRVLATRVEEYFAKLLESLAAANKSRKELKAIAKKRDSQNEEPSFLFDADDDVTWKASLPDKYSLLEDKHFPLFLTYEKLAQLLEGDIIDKPAEPQTPVARGRLVTYDVFIQEYWPHLPQRLARNLDPSLVYGEFVGVIEGSEAALSQTTRYLDQSTYEGLSHRTQHVYTKHRDIVYTLFLAFLKQKRLNGDHDVADRTHRILRAFEIGGVPGTKIDYLYVDEVQDNLLIDAMLLRSICRNPDGLFWAGDTAQTIAVGSSFRFNDLKAFLYRLEKRREGKLFGSQKGAQGKLKTFQLTVNYRSHGGIVRCAHSVIELITHFWPYAIDSMAPEQGIVDGLKPVFYSGWDSSNVRYEQFLFGDSGDRLEFGARQCILVRDENARTELRKQVGDIGLILTLYESKGLEFDDVLLYKFFEDSLADVSQWRVVLTLPGSNPAGSTIHAPRFDETRHAGICSELKFLYVAITRARKNLWIVDCSEKAEPMKILWTTKDSIRNFKPGSDLPKLAVSSSPEEWEKTARILFINRRYLQAMHAFQRAGLEREVKISHAHYLREEARAIHATTEELVATKHAFVRAAKSFLECAATSRGKERRVFYHNAADCYERAAEIFKSADEAVRAAAAYETAEEYNDAIRLYRKYDKFDEAVKIVTSHRDKVKPDLAQNVVDVARLFYFKEKELKKAQKLFDSVEEQLEYLEDNVLLDECHAEVLIELGRYQDAADVHLAEGRTLEAIQTLLRDEVSEVSAKRANGCILQGLWQNVSFAMIIRKESEGALRMLDLAAKMNADLLSPSERDELAMFQAIRSMDLKSLREIAKSFHKRKERFQELMCLDYCFAAPPQFAGQENTAICLVLEGFLAYCDLLKEAASTLTLADAAVQRSFGFQPTSSEGMFQLHRETWLHQSLSASPALIVQTLEGTPELSGQVIQNALKSLLWKRLATRIRAEDDLCQRTRAFTPCLPFVMNEQCNLAECPRDHIAHQKLSEDWHTVQLRICLLQILVVHRLHAIPNSSMENRMKQRRFWIRKLFDTLYPPTHFLGSASTARLDRIPEAQSALSAIKAWCRDILYTRPHPRGPDSRVLTTIYEAVILSLTVDRDDASKYAQHGPYILAYATSPIYRRPTAIGDVYVVPELLLSLKGSEKSFITAGLLFLKQVLHKQLPLDINVVRHFVEFLAGSVVLARVNFNVHNVTLPRSWFLILFHHISQREDVDTRLLDLLLDCISHILQALINGGPNASNLLFEGRNLSEVPVIRDLYIAPFCRAVVLVGYNINNSKLRADIVKRLRPLKLAKPHWTFKSYTGARDWSDLASALRFSTESGLDDLVQLCHESSKSPQRPPPKNINRVIFKSLEDVRRTLAPHISSLAIASSLRAEAPAFVPRSMKQPEAPQTLFLRERDHTAPEREAEAQVEEAADKPDADTTDIVDSGKLVDNMANTVSDAPHEVIPDEQLIVARELVKRYRHRVAHRNFEKKKSAADSQVDSTYETCLKLSMEMGWPNGNYYKKLYLGLVPHLLVCVNAVQTHAQSAKGIAKKQLLKGKRQNLDDLSSQMTELSAIFKLCKDIHKRLEPQSTLHEDRDLSELKLLVGKVEDLFSRVSTGLGEARFHLELAIKGIVKEPPHPKPAPKPELNMDDEVMLTKEELQAEAYEHYEYDY